MPTEAPETPESPWAGMTDEERRQAKDTFTFMRQADDRKKGTPEYMAAYRAFMTRRGWDVTALRVWEAAMTGRTA